MNFHLFYRLAAFLFGFGVMEVGALYHVNSLECESYSEGHGIIEYYSPHHLVFIGEKYKHYKSIMGKLEDPKYPCDPWTSHLAYVAARKIQGHGAVEGTHAYALPDIVSYTHCNDNSMTIKSENKEVKITFSDAADCQDLEKFLHDQTATFGYHMHLKNLYNTSNAHTK